MTKLFLITGASSGIGKALSVHLASQNHKIIAVARRQSELEELKKLYPTLIEIVVADITNNDGQLKIKQAIPKDTTALYLVHNAGIALPRLIEDISEKEWDQHFSVNLKAPFFITKLLLPYLKNGGRVLHVSTGLAQQALPGFLAYGVSKAAFYSLKEYCNAELNSKGIFFSSVRPGAVDTDAQQLIRNCDSKRFPNVNKFRDFHTNGKLLKPSTIANFLCWILLQVDDENFIKSEWNIYDTTHHRYWANSDDIVS